MTYSEAFNGGYNYALEALAKKNENDNKPGILNMLKALVEKAIKLITETVPNFFRKLFGKDPKYKNDPRVKKNQ